MSTTKLTLDNGHTVSLKNNGGDVTELFVDGRMIGCIDFFNFSDGSGPVQVVIDGGLYEEPLAKLLIPTEPTGKLIVVVNKNARVLSDATPMAIHHSGDWVFEGEPEGT